MTSILIVEDISAIANRLKKNIERLGYSCAGIASNLSEARKIINNESPNLAILDIDLNGVENGLDLAPELSAKNIPFIVLSDLKGKAIREQVLMYPPAGYMIKPITKDNLLSNIELALVQRQQKVNEGFFRFKQNDGFTKLIDFENIVYLKADKGGREIYHLNSRSLERVVDTDTLTNFMKSADSASFIQVNRSYIVNVNQIESYTYSELKLKGLNEVIIPIGKTHRKRINSLLESK